MQLRGLKAQAHIQLDSRILLKELKTFFRDLVCNDDFHVLLSFRETEGKYFEAVILR